MSHETKLNVATENNFTAKTVHVLSRNLKAFYRKDEILGFANDRVRLVEGVRWIHSHVRLLKNG